MARLPFVLVLLCFVLLACVGQSEMPAADTSAPPPSAPAAATPTNAPATPSDDEPAVQAHRCLPLVSGCGCAERCGDGFQQANGSWGVVRPLGDSALDEVAVGRRCFDARGVSYDASSAPASASLCVDVFLEPQICGGECIPRTEFLHCASSDDHECRATP